MDSISRSQFKIGILCALQSESNAVEALLDEVYEKDGRSLGKAPGDPYSYLTGRIGAHNVVLAYMPQMGKRTASHAASFLSTSFTGINLCLVVGICAAVPKPRGREEIFLGDILISTEAIEFDFGRRFPDRFEPKSSLEGNLRPPPEEVLSFLRLISGDTTIGALMEKTLSYLQKYQHPMSTSMTLRDVLYPQNYRHKHQVRGQCQTCDDCITHDDSTCEHALQLSCEELNCGIPERERIRALVQVSSSIHFGPFASGSSVMKSAYDRDRIAESTSVIGFEMEGAGAWSLFPTIIVKSACDYGDSHKSKEWQPYAAASAAACLKALLDLWRPHDDVPGSVKRQLSLPIHEESRKRYKSPVPPLDLSALDQLPHVPSAMVNSKELEGVSHCLPGTRVKVLNDIKSWADDPKGAPIFWLYGIAGTGKSTIAKSVAQHFLARRRLGASDRGNANKILTAIARQLAFSATWNELERRELTTAMKQAVSSSPEIHQMAFSEQWRHLILEPLEHLATSNPTTEPRSILIVIDALDECDPLTDIPPLLELFPQATYSHGISLRFFVTGRPEEMMKYGFRNVRRSLAQIALHDIEKVLVQEDIRRFVEHKLGEARSLHDVSEDWPSTHDVGVLTSRANGLFIYAAVICRIVHNKYPRQQLKRLLNLERTKESYLDDMYRDILTRAILVEEDEDDNMDPTVSISQLAAQNFKDTIGPLAISFDSLSIQSLSSLMCGAQDREGQSSFEDAVNETISSLASVLDVPDSRTNPIRFFHASFRDFLIEEGRMKIQALQLRSEELHEHVLERCISTMMQVLKKDICSLRYPGKQVVDIPSDKIDSSLPKHVQYACRYWVSHLQKTPQSIQTLCLNESGIVGKFLTTKILYWLEAMLIMGHLKDVIPTILALKALVTEDFFIGDLIQDTYEFVLRNGEGFQQAPRQIYCSALLFSPSTSPTRKLFQEDIPSWFKVLPRVSDKWPTRSMVLNGHTEYVTCVVFSDDGKFLASGSTDGRVCIWDTLTGLLQHSMNHHDKPNLLKFSPDNQQIAGVSGTEIRSWDLITGRLRESFYDSECEEFQLLSLSYTPDGRSLAFISTDLNLTVWNLDTGKYEWDIKCPLSRRDVPDAHSDAIYHYLSSGRRNTLVEVAKDYYLPVGTVLRLLKTMEVQFSPDGQIILTVTPDLTITQWNAKDGRVLGTVSSLNFNLVNGIAISRDCRFVVLSLISAYDFTEFIEIVDSSSGRIMETCYPPYHGWEVTSTGIYGDILIRMGSEFSIHRKYIKDEWDEYDQEDEGDEYDQEDEGDEYYQEDEGDKYYQEDESELWERIAFSPISQMIALAKPSGDFSISVWDMAIYRSSEMARRRETYDMVIQLSGNAQFIVALNGYGDIRVYDAVTGDSTWDFNSKRVQTFSLTGDDKLLAASTTSQLKIFETIAFSELLVLDSPILDYGVAFSPDSRKLAYFTTRNNLDVVRVHDLETCKIQELELPFSNLHCRTIFSRDSKQIIITTRTDIYVWVVGTSSLVHSASLDLECKVVRLSLSSDEKYLAILWGANDSRGIDIWELATGVLKQSSNNRLLTPTVFPPSRPCGWGIHERWITYREANIIFLPQDRRESRSDANGDTLVISSDSNIRTILHFNRLAEYMV